MHQRDAVFFDGVDKFIDEVVQPFFCFGIGGLAVQPVRELVVRDYRNLLGEGVLELERAYSHCFFEIEVDLFQQCDFVLLLVEFGVV